MDNLKQAGYVKQFLYSEQFEELKHLAGAFNPYRMLGIAHKELAHSNLLAYLLDPQGEHGLGSQFTNEVFKRIMAASTPECVPAPVGCANIIVRREYMYVDIIVECRNNMHVIAIENKIWHHERGNQLRDYQDRILEKYKGWRCTLVFLTPSGRTSETHGVHLMSACPVVSLGYKAVADAIMAVAPACEARLRSFLELTAEHIREDLVDGGKMKELVRQIWSNPENIDALRVLEQYRPRLTDIQEAYFAGVQSILIKRGFSDGAIPYTYPLEKGEARELKFKVKKWDESNVPFEFVLYSHDGVLPVLKLMLHKSSFPKSKETLDLFAKQYPNLVGENPYPAIRDWPGWYAVLSEDDDQDISKPVVGDGRYDDETVRQAFAKVEEYLDKLIGPVTAFISASRSSNSVS